MKNIFDYAERCLHEHQIDEKLLLSQQAWDFYQKGDLNCRSSGAPENIEKTKFPSRPELLDPRQMPRRKFTTLEGRRAFFHAIAHIEFMAIYLAWDILYRFRDLPEDFYRDWLQVAYEETLHFSLIRKHMNKIGVDYGDLPAHQGLWDIAVDTADDVLARLALVPRYMEARGLDVTPAMIERFAEAGDSQSVVLLNRILTDEIGHVALGNRWFQFVCLQRGLDAEEQYRLLVLSRLKGKRNGPINREMRKQAGFTETELNWLEKIS